MLTPRRDAQLALAREVGPAPAPAADDEPDALDAFMAGVSAEVAALPAKAAAPRPAAAAAAEEEYDPVASFMEARGRGGVAGGAAAGASAGALGYDSDEDVYATAAALDAASGQAAEEATREAGRRDAAPLAAVDHEAAEYEAFDRDFYTPAPEVARLSAAEVAARCGALGVRLGGRDPPAPVERFGQCGLPAEPLLLLKQRGYEAPTPVQAAALPAALSGRDVLAAAQTGSGKTVAFLLPALVHAAAQRALEPGEGPIVLVLAPTRELGQQIHGEARRLGAPFGCRAAALLGGHDKGAQLASLRAGAELAVATPGRAIDLARAKQLRLSRVTFVVLDEADRLLSLGFEAAVRSLAAAARPDAQMLLFSATLPQRVAALAADLLEDAVRLAVGDGGASADVAQRVEVLPSEAARLPWLLDRVAGWVDAGEVLVFASRTATCGGVAAALTAAGVRAAAMHGDMDQAARSAALAAFRAGQVHCLVATDVAARGLDVPALRTVLNFEPARDADTHTHRVGRTGRAGATGCVAWTLLTSADAGAARMLVAQMEAAYQPVSADLYALAMRDARFRKSRRGGPGRGAGGPRVGGRGLGFDDAAGFVVSAVPRGPPPLRSAQDGRFKTGFVASSDGAQQPQLEPQIVAPKSGWKPAYLPPPPPGPPPHGPPPGPLPGPPPGPPPGPLPGPPPMPPAAFAQPPAAGVDPMAAARAAAAAIAARLVSQAPLGPPPSQPPFSAYPPPPLLLPGYAQAAAPPPPPQPHMPMSFNAMPPPASLNAMPTRPNLAQPALTPQQAAARAAAEAFAARMFASHASGAPPGSS